MPEKAVSAGQGTGLFLERPRVTPEHYERVSRSTLSQVKVAGRVRPASEGRLDDSEPPDDVMDLAPASTSFADLVVDEMRWSGELEPR